VASSRIANLVLASDFVRTHTDLATMEDANEAARRAVNAILDRAGSQAPRCPIWKLREPGIFAPARALDRIRWKLFRRPPRSPCGYPAGRSPDHRTTLATVLVRWLPCLAGPHDWSRNSVDRRPSPDAYPKTYRAPGRGRAATPSRP
jgi:hypothetical protein